MNKLLIVLFSLRCLFNKATFILNKTGGSFWPIPRNWKLSLDSFQLNHGCKPISKHQCTIYWDCNHFIGNVGIQYIFMRTRWYQEVLQNNHFSDNTQQGKTDKGYENRPIIDHLDESFQVVFSNEPEQSIDEHMAKLKGRFFSLSCPNIIKLYNNGMGYRYNGSKNSCVQTRSQKQVYRFYLRMFFDLIDVTHVYMKLGDTYLYRNSKLSLQILWSANTVIVRGISPPVDQAHDNLMN